jgi:hypothetical protein
MTVNNVLAMAYRHMKEAANMAYEREIYDIEYQCREAIVNIAHVANALGLDDGPWVPADDLAD